MSAVSALFSASAKPRIASAKLSFSLSLASLSSIIACLCLGSAVWNHVSTHVKSIVIIVYLPCLGTPTFRKIQSNLDFSISTFIPPPPNNFWNAYLFAHPDFKIPLPPTDFSGLNGFLHLIFSMTIKAFVRTLMIFKC